MENNERSCEYCREIITIIKSTPRRKRFCSPKCAFSAWVEANPERYRETQARNARKSNERSRKPARYERICKWCSTEFIATRSDKYFCSRSCRNKQDYRDDREEMIASFREAQDGKCYLCENPLPVRQHLDHDHSCCGPKESCEKCRRGLSHPSCNHIIGLANDDPERLYRIAKNLEAAKVFIQT